MARKAGNLPTDPRPRNSLTCKRYADSKAPAGDSVRVGTTRYERDASSNILLLEKNLERERCIGTNAGPTALGDRLGRPARDPMLTV